MNVQEAFQKLREHGFMVGDPAAIAKIPIDERFMTFARYQIVGKHGEFLESSSIEFRQGRWVLVRWSYAPGPGHEDFEAEFESIDQAVAALIAYYTGQPILINEWVLPVHKHPEWDMKRLPSVIAEAQHISPEQWHTIHMEHRRRRLGIYPINDTPLSEVFACLFLPIAHSIDPTLTLHLRRDLGVAYIVRQQDTSSNDGG